VALVALFAINFATHQQLSGYARSIAGMTWSMTGRVTTSVLSTGFFSSRAQLARENAQLRSLVEMLQENKLENDILKDENAALRELTNAVDENARFLTARVMSSLDASLYDTIAIRAGTADGIAVGAGVRGPGGVGIGSVASADAHSALVQLYTKAGERQKISILDAGPLSFEGHGNSSGSVDVPRGVSIATGTPVYLSGTRTMIGTTVHIEAKPSDALQKIYVLLPFNPNSLVYVSVEKLP
jgi:cell shape-determining protein MreC